MRKELLDFSLLIDERFEIADEPQVSWFAFLLALFR
jgi:hypothetical protein